MCKVKTNNLTKLNNEKIIMNITTENKTIYKDPERTNFIKNMKDRLITVKPVRDETYGNIYQNLFLEDYVLYALLRNTKDFTKTASKKEKAIESAIDIAKFLKMLVTDIEKILADSKVSEQEALKMVSKKWSYTGYKKLNEKMYFTGESPLTSIKLLIEDIESAISKAAL